MKIVKDTKWKENKDTPKNWKSRKFATEQTAEFYIERHPRPNDLICYNLEEIHMRILQLIQMNNYISVIAKVINISDEEFNKILKVLSENDLVKNMGRNWLDKFECDRYEIMPKGEAILKREL